MTKAATIKAPFAGVAILALVFICLTDIRWAPAWPTDEQGRPVNSLAPMLEGVTPGVVNIATEGTIRQQYRPALDPLFQRFFKLPRTIPFERKFNSLGSGVIIDAKRGLILTNHHVINNADQITVTLLNGQTMAGKVIGSDPDTDVAVIQVDAKDLTALPVADSDNIRVGDFVVAIGNPFNLGHSISHGIVSALYRSGLDILNYENFIQTDASINRGNSGGALVNLKGELVGINTAILSPSQQSGNIGIGFAIPINQVIQIMKQILEHGEVKRGTLGVQIQDISPDLSLAFGLENNKGALITRIFEDSPADKAGLAPGDIILSVNDKSIDDSNDLRNRIGLMRPDASLQLKVQRQKKIKVFNLKIGDSSESRSDTPTRIPLLAGLSLKDNDNGGVRVTIVEQGTKAWLSGLRAGDVVIAVNRTTVKDSAHFIRIANNQNTLLLRILRDNHVFYLSLK